MPGDHVAVRWQGDFLCALIELIPRPFTPTVIVDGCARTDDVVSTRLVEQLLSVHCPDLEADVVSAGYRVGNTASTSVVSLFAQLIGSDPAPAYRRTWIMLRANPLRSHVSARRRDDDVAGLIRYLVASATRIADDLASHGVNALCERSFDDFDQATHVRFERERWSTIKGQDTFTAAYTASGGPDVWWSVAADHVVTRFRIVAGMAPVSTVLLTTGTKAKRPAGFRRVSGGQRAALQGQTLVTDRHCSLPIGSAGVLVGETMSSHPIYLPLDDVDVCVSLDGARTFTQFVVRSAAAGGIVTLGSRFDTLAQLIGAEIGPEAKVSWPHATTYLGPHPGLDRVVLQHDFISTPRHEQVQVRPITGSEERYVRALPKKS
jgi:type VII secretion protein EccE